MCSRVVAGLTGWIRLGRADENNYDVARRFTYANLVLPAIAGLNRYGELKTKSAVKLFSTMEFDTFQNHSLGH